MDKQENAENAKLKNHRLRIWLWLSVAAAVCGAFMLYPIGTTAANVFFILIKAGMVTGLIMLLAGNRYGFCVWGSFSLGAVIMTIIKWAGAGHAEFLFIAAIIVDILMPLAALHIYRQK